MVCVSTLEDCAEFEVEFEILYVLTESLSKLENSVQMIRSVIKLFLTWRMK